MLRKDLPFPGMLTAIKNSTRKLPNLDEVEPVEIIEIKHVSEGENQSFLRSYQREVGVKGIQEHFEIIPLTFQDISFPEVSSYQKSKFTLTIDDVVSFSVKLINIKAKHTYKLGQDTVTYTLVFEKLEANPEISGTLHAHYLNQKTRDYRDKIVPMEFPIKLELLEGNADDSTNLL